MCEPCSPFWSLLAAWGTPELAGARESWQGQFPSRELRVPSNGDGHRDATKRGLSWSLALPLTVRLASGGVTAEVQAGRGTAGCVEG